MSIRRLSAAACVAAALFAGCKDDSPISHAPTTIKIVSGGNQIADVAAPLDSSLVVQVVDGAGKAVSGVQLTWTATGGGTVTPASTTTDNDGKSSAKWTLGASAGTQVVTVSSASIVGVAASFIAGNGATISGSVTINSSQSPFTASLSRAPDKTGRVTSASLSAAVPRYSPDRIVIGFRAAALGAPAAGSMSYRSMSLARQTATTMRQRLTTMTASLKVSNAEVSPTLLAARVRVEDPSTIDAVMAKLSQDPNVEYVERDVIASAPKYTSRPLTQLPMLASLSASAAATSAALVTRLPNDPNLLVQYWNYNMIGLPRAWAITTGSPNVIVAVLDMGVRFDDPALAANLTADGYDFVAQNKFGFGAGGTYPLCAGGSIASDDADGDGPDPDPSDPDDLEENGNCYEHSTAGDHGQWTAGIIGEVGNNGAGGTGINWNVKIRPVRVLGVDHSGSAFDISQGILYAAGLPAPGAGGTMVQTTLSPIMNMSLGGYGLSTTERNAVAAAVAAGSLIIASSGNDAVDLPQYPAAFPGVMAVSAVGPDGTIASYSNAGPNISVAAPGGEPRLDFDFFDTGGDWVWGRWWDFSSNRPVFTFNVGTSASAPHVSGVAALILAQTPGLSATALRTRIEQFATRAPGRGRDDNYGWGVVNAFNALTQTGGPAAQAYARLLDATTGATVKNALVTAAGNFTFTKVPNGTYYVQVGEDEAQDATIGNAGRRFAWAGGFGTPTVFNVNNNAQAAAVLLGYPTEVEPNDDVAKANLLSVGSYVTGQITTPDVRDIYRIIIPVNGTYTIETSGVVGTCGLGLELDTSISLATSTGTAVPAGSNDNVATSTGLYCSRIRPTLAPGIYYLTVTASGATGNNFTSARGRYRVEVRSGQ